MTRLSFIKSLFVAPFAGIAGKKAMAGIDLAAGPDETWVHFNDICIVDGKMWMATPNGVRMMIWPPNMGETRRGVR